MYNITCYTNCFVTLLSYIHTQQLTLLDSNLPFNERLSEECRCEQHD